MASPVTAAGGEISIPIGAAAAEPLGAAKREARLNCFVCFVAFGEWAGDAFGTLASLWATVVLLGGFCTVLDRVDFWFATVIIFIEAFRMFSSNYRLGHQSLFGTTRAIKSIKSCGLMFVRPQERNEVVAIVGLFFNLVLHFPLGSIPVPALLVWTVIIFTSMVPFPGVLQIVSRLRRHRRLLLWALLVALLGSAGLQIKPFAETGNMPVDALPWCLFQLAPVALQVLAVLLLNLRPARIANLTNSTCGRKLLSSAKVILVLCLAADSVLSLWTILTVSLTILVLSIGSLQTPVDSSRFGYWVTIILYICFLSGLVSTSGTDDIISVIIMVAVLLVGNLQIPSAVARVVLSSLRLSGLASDVSPQVSDSNRNLVPSIAVFYVLALCQGTLYLVACIVELFSFFLRRSLLRHSGFRGQWGVRAVDEYYQRAYVTCLETGVLTAGRTMGLASFSIESLSSSSREMQLVGVCVLDGLLQQRNSSEELVLRITSSSKAVCTLIGMLGWTAEQDREIRLFAARVIAELAGNLRIASIPSMLKLVSSLLDDEKQPAWHHHQQVSLSHAVGITGENVVDNQSLGQGSSAQPGSGNGGNAGAGNQPTQGEDNNRGCSWVCRCWGRMMEHWSIPNEPPLTHQDSFHVLGMLILESLACDTDNCAEIGRATNLIFKIAGFISYNTDTAGDDAQQTAVICSSLNLVRRLAITGGKIGTTLRQELWESPILLSNLAGILEDRHSRPQLLKPAMEIIAKFALDEGARQEIGSTRVVISKLMHVFLGRDGPTNMYYDQPLRKTAGEALANLAMENTVNCLAILQEPGYELVKDLKNMISDDEYRYVATSLLQNLCAHCRDELQHPGAREHLSSALPAVTEKIMAAEDRELEALIGLASQICNVIPECFVHELESHTNGAGLVRKLVDTLNSNKKPSPEYPRMRRIIVQLTISFVESCPHYATIFLAEGMMEALFKVERTPSKVEKHRAFFGNVGVVLESGLPLPILVDRAKSLIDSTTPTPSVQPSNHV